VTRDVSTVVTVKLSLCLTKHRATKTSWGNGGIAPRILNTRLRWVVSLKLRPLYPQGKRPLYTLDRRLGGPQSRSERNGEEKKSQLLTGIKPHPVSCSLYWLSVKLQRVVRKENILSDAHILCEVLTIGPKTVTERLHM